MLIQAACTLTELLVWWESSKPSVQKCCWGRGRSKGGRSSTWFWGVWESFYRVWHLGRCSTERGEATWMQGDAVGTSARTAVVKDFRPCKCLVWLKARCELGEEEMEASRSWKSFGGGLVAKFCPTLATPWSVAHQAPLSMGFYRQEYWTGLPWPPPGDLSEPRKS